GGGGVAAARALGAAAAPAPGAVRRRAPGQGGGVSAPLLDIRALHKAFGGLKVTRDVSLQLHAGNRVGLIGPNGAGKTTLINLITGALEPSAGEVWLLGENVTTLSAPRRVKRGLARTFQITQLAPLLPI